MHPRERVERILEQRPSKPLRTGDHMLVAHALRCTCQGCGRLMRVWEEDGFLLVAECCKRRYTLKPQSVIVRVEDLSDARLLEPARGSEFPGDVSLGTPSASARTSSPDRRPPDSSSSADDQTDADGSTGAPS